MTNSAAQTEAILEPDLPIIDPHHHLWDKVLATHYSAAEKSALFSGTASNVYRLKV